MRGTNRDILEGSNYYKDFNKGKRVKKKVAKSDVGEQLLLPFPENEELRGTEEKDRK